MMREGLSTSKELPKDNAEAVHIDLLGDLKAHHNLRRHVERGAACVVGVRVSE